MISDINHISFTISNLEDSIKFYTKAVGLKLINKSKRSPEYSAKVTGIPGAELRIAYLSANNCRLELIQYLAGAGIKIDTTTNNVGSAHLCFNVDNINNFVKIFQANGGRVINQPLVIPSGPNKGKRGFYGEDQDGNKLEFISNEKYFTEK